MNLKLKMGIGFLLMQCNAGGAPETYAEVVLDSVPAEAVQALLAQPDPIAWLAAIEPKVQQPENVEWFRSLIEAVREMLSDEREQDELVPHVMGQPNIAP